MLVQSAAVLFLDRLTPLDSLFLGFVLAAIDLVAVGRALLRGHGVGSTLAWLIAILAFPGVGAVLYLSFANPRVRGQIRAKRSARTGRRSGESATPDELTVIALARGLTGVEASSGNRVELLSEDATAFGRIEAALEGATRAVWAEYYLVRNDETGHRFLSLLASAAARGVDVKLLYDAVGSMGLDRRRLAAIRAAGGRAEPFLPVNPLRRRWAVHLRNHRKLVVVDDEVAFTGGMNVGDEYSGRSRLRGEQHFLDSHLEVRGPAVRAFLNVFADDWSFATGVVLEISDERAHTAYGGAVVAALPSGPDDEDNASACAYFEAITSSRRSCFLTTPYFVPDEPTVRALIVAARRGVDVRLVLPARCDRALVGFAARSYYRVLVAGGVRVFEYLPSMLHAKTIVVDRAFGIVGSANVDMRSFRLNFEIGAIVADEALASMLEARFLRSVLESREITSDTIEHRGLASDLVSGVARLASPLL